MAETVQASQQDGHFNESIVNEEILEDMKKNRIDHMKYLPDMEQLEESDVMDQVISAMNAYDYDKYTEADVRRALAHDNRTPEDFQALLSPAALPLLEEIAVFIIAQGCGSTAGHSACKQNSHTENTCKDPAHGSFFHNVHHKIPFK